MADFVHIPSGTIVSVREGKILPADMFMPLEATAEVEDAPVETAGVEPVADEVSEPAAEETAEVEEKPAAKRGKKASAKPDAE